ncbi:TolC family protein [Thiomicrorhabdus sediminis]|nr:TolC family protein [Thiomicrorhabdus sediminis]
MLNGFQRPSLKTTILLCAGLFNSPLLLAQNASAPAEGEIVQAAQQSAPVSLPVSLPNPLSLEALLADYAQLSPNIRAQQAMLEISEANGSLNESVNNWQLALQGRLGYREFKERSEPNHRLVLHVGKVFYDFGRFAAQAQSDALILSQRQLELQQVENLQKLQVIKAYFNALLSDFQYRVDNEAMAIEYVGFDKLKERHAIGQASDVDLLAGEQLYQKALVKRMQSEQAQLKTRVELANTIGLPQARPDELVFPKLDAFKQRQLGDMSLAALQQQVLEKNPQMQALQQAYQALQFDLQKAQNLDSPTLRGDAWAGQLDSYPQLREGSWKAQISIDVPLYDGGNSRAGQKLIQAKMNQMQANMQLLAQQLRAEVADVYFQIKLLDAEQKQHKLFGDYADLYLDFSRALYENESATDLGDSMVRLSEANYNMVEWQFKQALLWLELDYLAGKAPNLNSAEVIAAQ